MKHVDAHAPAVKTSLPLAAACRRTMTRRRCLAAAGRSALALSVALALVAATCASPQPDLPAVRGACPHGLQFALCCSWWRKPRALSELGVGCKSCALHCIKYAQCSLPNLPW